MHDHRLLFNGTESCARASLGTWLCGSRNGRSEAARAPPHICGNGCGCLYRHIRPRLVPSRGAQTCHKTFSVVCTFSLCMIGRRHTPTLHGESVRTQESITSYVSGRVLGRNFDLFFCKLEKSISKLEKGQRIPEVS